MVSVWWAAGAVRAGRWAVGVPSAVRREVGGGGGQRGGVAGGGGVCTSIDPTLASCPSPMISYLSCEIHAKSLAESTPSSRSLPTTSRAWTSIVISAPRDFFCILVICGGGRRDWGEVAEEVEVDVEVGMVAVEEVAVVVVAAAARHLAAHDPRQLHQLLVTLLEVLGGA